MNYPVQTLPSTLIANGLTTVEINGIATPFNLSLDSLQRFCRPVLFYRDDCAFELAYSGSSLLFRLRGHNFLMCCKHQLLRERLKPSAICLVLEEDGKRVALSPDASTTLKVDSYLDRTPEDILFVEYHSERNGRNLDRYFLSFDLDAAATLASVPPGQVTLIFAIGYPTRFADYEIKFDEAEIPVSADVVSRWVKLYLQPRERSDRDLQTRIPLQVHERCHADIGDQTASAVRPGFSFGRTRRARRSRLRRMITHGSSSGAFQIYPAEAIKAIVKDIMDKP